MKKETDIQDTQVAINLSVPAIDFMRKSIYSVLCTNIFSADLSGSHVDPKKSRKEERNCLAYLPNLGHFNHCLHPQKSMWTPFCMIYKQGDSLAALIVSSLCFSLRCPKRYEQNGGRLTSWCIITASVTIVPVCKSAGNCPVKSVFRDVTEVKLLTFLLWMFISTFCE